MNTGIRNLKFVYCQLSTAKCGETLCYDMQHTKIDRRKDGGVEAPISLKGLFNRDSDSESETNMDGDIFKNEGENQILTIGDKNLTIRQTCWHQANANKVWPGTFLLADYLLANKDKYCNLSMNSNILELGAATGALSIFLLMHNFPLITRFHNFSLLKLISLTVAAASAVAISRTAAKWRKTSRSTCPRTRSSPTTRTSPTPGAAVGPPGPRGACALW
jgi:hypothetical protein